MFTTQHFQPLRRLLLVISFLLVSANASAITLDQAVGYAAGFGGGFGTLIDVWSVDEQGGDSTANVAAALGVSSVTQLARNNDVFYSSGLLNVSLYPDVFAYNTGDQLVGLWGYLGQGTVDVLAVSTAGFVALYGYEPGTRFGGWSTLDIAGFLNPDSPNYQGMTSIAAYSISAVPLPATAPLFLAGLLLFGFLRRRRKTHA